MRRAETRLIAEVPSDWRELPLKRIADVIPSNVDKKSVDEEERVRLCNYTDVYYNDRITSDLPFMEATATTAQILRLGLVAGDVIITKDSESADDIARAAFVPNSLPGVVCGYHLAIVRPVQGTLGEYLKYFFDSQVTRAEVATLANGLTRVALGVGDIGNLTAALPSLAEQSTIVEFLNRETAMIDALIAEQERLIALLQEKRQAVISHAVTKGLDQSVPMKESGVDWIGRVPSHWQVFPGRRIARPFSTESIPDDALRSEGEIMYLKVSSLPDKKLALSDSDWFVSSDANVTTAPTRFIVFPKRGAAIGLNRVNVVTGPAMLDPNLMGWMPKDGMSLDYLAFALKARCLVSLADVSTIPQLNNKHIDPAPFPVPPAREQIAISEGLHRQLADIDTLQDNADGLRAVLAERRTALITAAVTGQIDVRGLVETAA